jgi:hypothetical protein
MPTIVQALSAVMADIGVVGKNGRNSRDNYAFRGIEDVVNAASPVFQKHGVVVVPELRDLVSSTVEVGKNRTLMGHVRVTVAFTFYGPDGDSVTAVTPGEAMDSGDKATSKAMSVAFRTALSQTLCLPTGEKDPDEDSYVRSDARPVPQPRQDDPAEVARKALVNEVWKAAKSAGLDWDAVVLEWAEAHGGEVLASSRDVPALEKLLHELTAPQAVTA